MHTFFSTSWKTWISTSMKMQIVHVYLSLSLFVYVLGALGKLWELWESSGRGESSRIAPGALGELRELWELSGRALGELWKRWESSGKLWELRESSGRVLKPWGSSARHRNHGLEATVHRINEFHLYCARITRS